MLLPLFVWHNLADVIAIVVFVVGVEPLVLFMGKCYCHTLYVTDVIVTFVLSCDWCYCHLLFL